jgi:hypothetical protein
MSCGGTRVVEIVDALCYPTDKGPRRYQTRRTWQDRVLVLTHLRIPSNQVLSTNASCSYDLVDKFAMKITSHTAGMAMLTALGSSSNVMVVFCATDSN